MSLFAEYFVYAAVFRLAIIASGTLSIFLGYRLFLGGLQIDGELYGKTEFNAKVSGATFALKNAAPGTFFALFGVVLVSVMLVQGNPELTLKTFSDAKDASSSSGSSEVTLRGAPVATAGKFDDAVQRGIEYDKKNDTANAVASYEESMVVVATPMNELAWEYLQQRRAEDALPLARLAVQLSPGKAAFLDTLAEVLLKVGQREEAGKWMAKAASLDPKYRSKLAEFQRTAKP